MHHSSQSQLFSALLCVLLLVAAGCSSANETDVAGILAGGGSRTWKAEIDTKSFEKKDRYFPQEWDEKITFHADGRFSMTSTIAPTGGTWTHNPAAETLTLVFEKENLKQEFSIRQLKKNEAKLVSNDGAVIELDAE